MNRKTIWRRNLPFARSVDVDRVTIEKAGTYGPMRMSFIKAETRQDVTADFELEIDLDALVARLFDGAAYSKGGRAQLAGGAVRLVRRNETVKSQEQRTHTPRDGWTETKGEK
jgi:hypothetical protein